MSFRVFDKKKKKFVTDNVFLTQDGELVESKRSLFGNRLTFVDQNRYVFQSYIGLNDKDNTQVYIGDYIEAIVADDRVVQGIVTYADELAAYVILCFDPDEYFVLSQSICDRIKVVGNVFDDMKKKK